MTFPGEGGEPPDNPDEPGSGPSDQSDELQRIEYDGPSTNQGYVPQDPSNEWENERDGRREHDPGNTEVEDTAARDGGEKRRRELLDRIGEAWRPHPCPLRGRPAQHWHTKATLLNQLTDSVGSWQHRAVTEVETPEELQEEVRRQTQAEQAARTDIYVLRSGKVIALTPSERTLNADQKIEKMFRRLFVEGATTLVLAAVDLSAGVPLSLLVQPTGPISTGFYLVSLNDLLTG